MITKHFLQHRRREQLNDVEKEALEAAMGTPVLVPRRTTITRRGDTVSRSTFLISGFMSRYVDGRDGQRQFVSLETAGDFVDLHGYPLQRLDHDIATLSDCQVSYIAHEKLTALIERFPHLGRVLWFSTLVDAAMHREWIFRLGRLDAEGRIAHLLCETYARLDAVGLVSAGTFGWPLTQQDFGEALGLTSVHVNRTLKALRERGLVEVSDRQVSMLDFDGLAKIAEFAPDYLYLDDQSRVP